MSGVARSQRLRSVLPANDRRWEDVGRARSFDPRRRLWTYETRSDQTYDVCEQVET